MSGPIRVLQVIGRMDQGGAEMMIMNLYRNIDRQKIQFDFVENENNGAFFDEEIRNLGGNIYHCPRFTGKNLFTYKKWWKDFLNDHREYKIVHGHIGSTAAFYLKEAKKHGIVTIAHSHNTDGKNRKQALYNILSYPTRYIADYLFMCSKQAGIDRYGQKAASDPNRAFFFPNSIETEIFHFDEDIRKKRRKELGIKDDEFLVGHVGRFAEQKNHSFLLDIFREITRINPNAKLLLVGEGDLRSSIEGKISSLGLTDKVILTGTRPDVNELMMAMDTLVFPSKYEGLPVTLVEAQCTGLPCVISDNVPADAILIEDSINILSLNDDASKWADIVLEYRNNNRIIYADKVKEAGFDIKESAKWLEEFYLEKAE